MPCPACFLPHCPSDPTLALRATSRRFCEPSTGTVGTTGAPFRAAESSQQARRRRLCSRFPGGDAISSSVQATLGDGGASTPGGGSPVGRDSQLSSFPPSIEGWKTGKLALPSSGTLPAFRPL